MVGDVATGHPDRPALVHGQQVITYGQLGQLVGAVAARLGPRPGTVAVRTRHVPGTVIGLLGIWTAGGTYCPVDPAFPADRQRSMLAAAGCTTVLDAVALVDVEPGDRTTTARTPTARTMTVRTPTARWPRPVPVGGDEPAYLLFTSGSTGTPKPVATPRTAIGTVVPALRALFGLTRADRVLQFASLNWDTCFEEILPALTAGAALVFDDEAYTGSIPRFLRMVARQRITVLDLPSAFWHELVHHLAEDGSALPDCVRLVVVGGEAVSPGRLADWRRLDTAAIRLLNTYGCTETTLITHAVDLHGPRATGPEAAPTPGAPVPIGRALPHVRERISDDGELLIGGPALGLGYHGMPEATAARFDVLPDPDGPARWFRTGDRVRRRDDGVLLHEGRLDNEVKIRGIRVDPAEVEARITEHPAVSAVAVVGVTVADHTTLAAYVVPSPPADPDVLAAALRDFLRERVPGHLIPSRVVIVPGLAYTASGKVDRAASHRRHATGQRVKEALQ